MQSFGLTESDRERRLRRLLEIVQEADLDVLEVESDDFTLTLRRNVSVSATSGAPEVQLDDDSETPSRAPRAGALPEHAETAPTVVPAGCVAVVASTVGVFYRSAEPGAAPFVDVGTAVAAGVTMGLVEVMKLFNAVASPVDGVVESVVAGDRDLVEYGQTLFVVRADS